MVSRFERFSLAISEIDRYWHKIAAKEMVKYGLKGPYAVYLVTMMRYPDGITAAQLCECCGRDKSDVSRAMATMEKKGLIKREGVNKNLYRALLKLTDEGKAAAQRVSKAASDAVEIAGKGVSDKNREVFYETLELIANNLQKLSEKGLPEQ